jgi:two-component system, chemotaxis family, chemotaxis protein CheY
MAKTALIVDDSVSMRAIVAFTLRQAGFDVVEGENGRDALIKMAGRKIEIIVTDLNMPVMDGFTFIRAVRERPDSKFTPILMLTTESQGDKKQKGKAAGATGWIVKPFNPQKLLDAIAKVLL